MNTCTKLFNNFHSFWNVRSSPHHLCPIAWIRDSFRNGDFAPSSPWKFGEKMPSLEKSI